MLSAKPVNRVVLIQDMTHHSPINKFVCSRSFPTKRLTCKLSIESQCLGHNKGWWKGQTIHES